ASGNFNMRDPVIYRIRYIEHHRQGTKWCIFPMYDFAHPIQDALEGITHSLCSLEYEDHRPLYNWVIENTDVPSKPRQIEFARLNIMRTVMSKRYLRRLVEEGYVSGWDDPRMLTLVGMRRRGYPVEAIHDFLARVGVAKADSTVDGALLEACVREALGNTALRGMAVLNPLKVTFSNWEEGKVDEITIENHPDHPEMGERTLNSAKTVYIEQEDFMMDPPKKFFRLASGRDVGLCICPPRVPA
ncbi:MAG: glutamine--tRNA ligase, partial [Clostridia bacterium]|nr:glutamine--tRNA ligase [Clostridia bacterium]